MSDPNKLARDYYDKLERDNILLREALERIATFDQGDGSTWRTIGDAPAIARDALLRAGKPEVRSCETSIKYVDLWHCPRCNGATRTFRHLYARVWCHDCGFVLREEGDQTVQHRTPAAPEAKE